MMHSRSLRNFLLAGLMLSAFFPLAAQEEAAPPAAAPSDPLLNVVEKAIVVTHRRKLTVGVHTPWQVVHGILAFRRDFMMKTPDGGEMSGVDWMASGALHNGQTLFEATPYGGRGRPFTKPYAFEGHPTQFLGYMAMTDLPLDFPFQAGDKKVTVADILNDAKLQLREGPEVTWTLWALAHYFPSDHQWVNSRGEPWSIERLVQIQTRESVLSSACGGTHGLFALAYARNRRIAEGKPLTGVWIEADQKVKRFVAEAKSLQNRDGSFSAAYFRGPEYSTDFIKRLPANGHILEFLMIALPDNQLQEDWVRRGVNSVASDLVENRKVACDCGPLYHAAHSLNLYYLRANPKSKVFGAVIAQKPKETSTGASPMDDKNSTTVDANSPADSESPLDPALEDDAPAPEKTAEGTPENNTPAAEGEVPEPTPSEPEETTEDNPFVPKSEQPNTESEAAASEDVPE